MSEQRTATTRSLDADGLRGDWMLYTDDEIDTGRMGSAIDAAATIIERNDAEWFDLRERVARARLNLLELAAATTDPEERARLKAKADGVVVVLGYLGDYGPQNGSEAP